VPDAPLVQVIDDDEAMRRSVAFLLASVGLETALHPDGEAFLASRPPEGETRPGCILLDVRMPGMSGLELLRHLVADGCPLPVILLTGHGDVPMAVSAMKSGAEHFIEKPYNDQQLLDAVAAAIRRSRNILCERAWRRAVAARLARLSRREREVLDRVLAGKLNKVIAAELDLSVKTVEVHRHAVMEKMEAGSVAELARMMVPSEDSPPRLEG
jgi:FixJ family two-component response regulator